MKTVPRHRYRLARRLSWLVVLSLMAVALFAPAALVRAAAPDPNYEFGAPGITVDGDRSEWTAADFFADMYRAGKPDFKVESKLYLRYNCDNGTLYVMVATVDGVVLYDGGDNFVKIDGDKKVGSPDIGNYTESADNAGWEASFAIAEGTYDLDVHTQVEDGGSQTSAVDGRSLVLTIDCPAQETPAPTPTPAVTPTPTPAVTPTPTPVVTPTPTPVVTPTPAPEVTPTPAPTPTPTPTGGVEGATATPPPAATAAHTLPPTDTLGDAGTTSRGDSWRIVLIALAAVLATALLLTPARAVRKDS